MNERSSTPLVSFVVPCYNYGRFLAACVNSILAQSFENFEVLIMDNCSPDSTPEVAQSFQDSRVRHIRNDSNIGHVRNYNKGITLARGKYIWVLCADDMLRSPAVLGQFVASMERDPNRAFVFCRALELQGETPGDPVRWADYGDADLEWNDASFFLRLIETDRIVMSSVMVRRECLDHAGLFPVDLPFCDDWYVWNRLAMQHGVAYFAEPMVYCRIHPASLTTGYDKDYARNCAGEELTVLARIARVANAEKLTHLGDAARASFVTRVRLLLMAGIVGGTPRIDAAEFEEILQTRLQNSEDVQPLRTAVYESLVKEIAPLYYLEEAPPELGEEIRNFWELWRHAESAGVLSLRDTCKRVLQHRLLSRLAAYGTNGNARLSNTNLIEALRGSISDGEAAEEIQAQVFRELADHQFTIGDYAGAAESYRLALAAQPKHTATSAKYLLLKFGAPGIWLRQVSHQLRESGRRN